MEKQTPRRRAARQRGMAMAMTLLMMLALLSMALIGMLAQSGVTNNSGSGSMTQVADDSLLVSANVDNSVTALSLADAGVQDTILWLAAQSAPPGNLMAFAPSASSFALPLWNATTQAGAPPRAVVQYPDAYHTFSVTLYPSSGNAGNSQKSYMIESIGNCRGTKQVIHVYLQQNSFGHYAFFENGAGGGTWDSSYVTFDGPVHMNNTSITHPMTLNWNDGGQPIFSYSGSDAYTVGFSLSYKHSGAATSGPPASSDSAGWAALSAGGPGSIKDGQNNIPMPSTGAQMNTQQAAALGALPLAPVTEGATVCPGGGIYIHGDVQQMTLSVDPLNSADQIIELYQITPGTLTPVYTKIEFSTQMNQTIVQTGTYGSDGTITLDPAASQPLPAAGLTNGVIYCDGNIGEPGTASAGGIKGTIADNAVDNSGNITNSNSLTIATDPTKNINIDGSIVDNTPRQIMQDSSGNYEFTNNLGQMVKSTTAATPASCVPDYVQENADTGAFATRAGRLGLVTYNMFEGTSTYGSTGTTVTGNNASVELDAALFSYGTLSMQSINSSATLIMGSDVHNLPEKGRTKPNYDKSSYDARLSNQPPPFFPTTSNRYTVISWQTSSQVIEGTL